MEEEEVAVQARVQSNVVFDLNVVGVQVKKFGGGWWSSGGFSVCSNLLPIDYASCSL